MTMLELANLNLMIERSDQDASRLQRDKGQTDRVEVDKSGKYRQTSETIPRHKGMNRQDIN
jgi:hypothetical protein